MSSKTYIVTSYSYTKGCEKYFETLSITGAIPLVVQFGTSPIKYPPHSKIYVIDKAYPGNTARFLPLAGILGDKQFKDDDWFVFTDTHDVEFQKKLPDLTNQTHHILVAHEGKLFKEVGFWEVRVPSDLLLSDVYNVGCFAMRGHMFKTFLLKLRKEWETFILWYKGIADYDFPYAIPVARTYLAVLFNSYGDTVIFNRFIRDRLFIELPGLFGCVNFNKEIGAMIQKRSGWITSDGKTISIVHHNGGDKQMKKYKQTKKKG